MTSIKIELEAIINNNVELENYKSTNNSEQIKSIQKMPGDASARKYYRVFSEQKSFVLMKMESFSKQGMQIPFLVMQAHLNSVGIEVPLVIEVHPEQGWVLLEDLGDITLLKKLQDLANPERERFLFERVIDCLVRLQYLASPQKKPAEIEAYRLSFDFEKLMWEVNFTIEHFYLQHLKRVFSATDEQKLRSGLSEICQILASEEKVLTHRDFHSRNVMVAPGDRLVMIDFQDARLGPAQYDLASLLRDSYYQIEEAQIDRLVDYYIAKWEAVSGNFVDRNHFRRVFDLMSVQRNFKAIGSFASFSNLRNNSQYLKYIGNTFENIRRTLTKYPEFHDLREVLTNYYYF